MIERKRFVIDNRWVGSLILEWMLSSTWVPWDKMYLQRHLCVIGQLLEYLNEWGAEAICRIPGALRIYVYIYGNLIDLSGSIYTRVCIRVFIFICVFYILIGRWRILYRGTNNKRRTTRRQQTTKELQETNANCQLTCGSILFGSLPGVLYKILSLPLRFILI